MKHIDPQQLEVVLATDCGSTTTKAVLFEKKADGWHQTFRGEAPTTVEKPVADVTIGAKNAFLEVQELAGRKLINENAKEGTYPLIQRTKENPGEGVDLYVSTSSAGGGLQMIVAGVVGTMSTESAERAALGAGAIVMDAVSIDDGREPYERVQKIRHLRPDIILLAGGTDGGNISHPLELSETILQADPRPRFGDTLKLPVLYAANANAKDQSREILEKRFAFEAVENLRPSLESENLTPARDAIHELFLQHVMSHAPGYKTLLSWTPMPILPTPAAVGDMVLAAAKRENKQILAVDIGGATTDVFSAIRSDESPDGWAFNRTVSANLGMSYSVANVLLEAGEEGIKRWLPFSLSSAELQDRLRNKMIRPTSIPHTMDDLLLEQAVCREALSLAFLHHKRLATGLKGLRKRRSIADLFSQATRESLIEMRSLDLIIGSGGVLSHAPDRKSAALMMIDAYQPLGVTSLAVDSIFMMPHLGVFASVHPEAAAQVFVRDCIVELGSVVATDGVWKKNEALLDVELEGESKFTLHASELKLIPYTDSGKKSITLSPRKSSIDMGAGPGSTFETTVHGGHVGIIFDGRGRPLTLPTTEKERVAQMQTWFQALGLKVG